MLRKTKKVVPWTAYLHIDSQPMSVVYLEKLNPEQRRHSVRANDPRRADARVELIARRVIGDRAGAGFRDLAAARQVAGLLAAGTALSVITKSLHEIRKWLPDAGQ